MNSATMYGGILLVAAAWLYAQSAVSCCRSEDDAMAPRRDRAGIGLRCSPDDWTGFVVYARYAGRVGDRGAGAMDQSADRAAAQQDSWHFLGAGFLGSNPCADSRQHEARGGGLFSRRGGVYSAGYSYGTVPANLSVLRSHRRDAAAGAAAGADSVGDAVFRSRRQDENLCDLFFLRLADPAQYARRRAQHRPGAGEYRPDFGLSRA